MKRLTITLLILIAVASAAQAQMRVQRAQRVGRSYRSERAVSPINGYLDFGVSTLLGNYSDQWNTGFHGGLGVGYAISPEFDLIFKMEYHNFSFDDNRYDLRGGSLSSLMFGVDGRYELGSNRSQVRPFMMGGFGLANASIGDFRQFDAYYPGSDETKAYVEIGAGLTFRNSYRTKMFVSVRYISVALDGDELDYVPITLGVMF